MSEAVTVRVPEWSEARRSAVAWDLACVIRERREELGYTQAEVADTLGWPRPVYTRVERAIHLPTLATVAAVFEILMLDIADVFGKMDQAGWRSELQRRHR